MKRLILDLKEITTNVDVSNLVRMRMKEFEDLGKETFTEIFKELCFCMLTANFSAKRAIEIQKRIGDRFLTLSKQELETKLRDLGYRFPRTRARYIVEARKIMEGIREILSSNLSEYEKREWLVRSVKGFGYKEASHFLRNIGYKDVAIIDFHILDILKQYSIVKKTKNLTKQKYLEIEEKLRKIAKKLNISLAELDLYLWYMETGNVLK